MNKGSINRREEQTGQDVGGKGGYTAFTHNPKRASAEETPLYINERGGLQYITVSAL